MMSEGVRNKGELAGVVYSSFKETVAIVHGVVICRCTQHYTKFQTSLKPFKHQWDSNDEAKT